MAGLRFSGESTTIAVLNSTTGDQLLDDIAAKNMNFSILTEDKKEGFLGETGDDVLTYYVGYEFTLDYEPTNAIKFVDFTNLILAQTQRRNPDEFAVRTKASSPDGGTFDVTFQNVKWGTNATSLGGRKETWSSNLRGMGKIFTIRRRLGDSYHGKKRGRGERGRRQRGEPSRRDAAQDELHAEAKEARLVFRRRRRTSRAEPVPRAARPLDRRAAVEGRHARLRVLAPERTREGRRARRPALRGARRQPV